MAEAGLPRLFVMACVVQCHANGLSWRVRERVCLDVQVDWLDNFRRCSSTFLQLATCQGCFDDDDGKNSTDKPSLGARDFRLGR